MSFLAKLEEKIKSANAQLQQHTGILSNISEQIEQLTANKAGTSNLIQQIKGFLVACEDMKKDAQTAVEAAKGIPAAASADAATANATAGASNSTATTPVTAGS